MATLEQFVLRVMDSDWTWVGLNRFRPAKEEQLGLGYLLLSSFFLGLPGLLLGAGAIYIGTGQLGYEVWMALFALVMGVEVPLHLLWARYWNRRARRLAGASS